MFCPKCKQEYKEGIKTCADCQVTLIPDLPPDQPEKASSILEQMQDHL